MTTNGFIIYLALAASSILNIIVPISGSVTVTPFLAILTDPHRAIGLASFYFLLSGIIRVYLFRKNIQWHEIKILLPLSLIAAFIGSLSLVAINRTLLLVIVLVFTVYFLLKRVKVLSSANNKKIKPHYATGFVGLLSGLLQGAGLAGSDLRNSYLFGKDLNIAQVHGTTALVGSSIFLLTTFVRLQTDQLTVPDLIPLLYIFPFILVGTLLGRMTLYKFSEKTTNAIVVVVMVAIVVFLSQKVLAGIF